MGTSLDAKRAFLHCSNNDDVFEFLFSAMKTRIVRWGNSLAIRIPRAYADQAGLSEGSAVEFVAEGQTLVLRRQRYRLDTLLKQINCDNIHGEEPVGRRMGRKEW